MIHVLETRESRERRIDGTTLIFAVFGTDVEDDAIAAAEANAPTAFGSWVRKPGPRTSYKGHKLYYATYDYGSSSMNDRPVSPGLSGGAGGGSPPAPPPPQAPASTDEITDEFTFNISGQSRKIFTSEETRSRTPRVGITEAPDFRQMIGVSKKSVEGTDRIEPKMEFTITKVFEFVTFAYLDLLCDLVGTINEDDFGPMGSAEELLFMGVSGKGGGQGADKAKPSLSFTFSRVRNRADLVITRDKDGVEEITVPVVKGWDYLWCYYLDEPSSTSIFTQRALAAYVERIYPKRNFWDLGIWGPPPTSPPPPPPPPPVVEPPPP